MLKKKPIVTKATKIVEPEAYVKPAEKLVKPKVDKRKTERETLAVYLRKSDLTVDEKRALVRKFNEEQGG